MESKNWRNIKGKKLLEENNNKISKELINLIIEEMKIKSIINKELKNTLLEKEGLSSTKKEDNNKFGFLKVL